MKKIAIMTDSSADISNEESVRNNLFVMRLPLVIDGKEYIEEDSISLLDFTTMMYAGAVAKTSQAVLGKLIEMWTDILKEYDEIVYIPISSNLSGSYSSAALCSESFDGRVIVVDAKFVCYPLQWLCLEAQKMVEKGYTGQQIKEKIETETNMWAVLIPEKLEYLQRGGRISKAAAALGNLLKIAPILKVEDGGIDTYDKVRTLKRAYQVAIEANSIENPEDYIWMVVEADFKEMGNELAASLEAAIKQPVRVVPMHATIMSHTGPRTIGIGRIKKLNY